MTVRDLGYRAYEGERLPATHNTWVLLRYGLWRGWGSWINKLAILFSPVIALIICALIGGGHLLMNGRIPIAEQGPQFLNAYFTFQLWLFVTVITLRSGAGVIAEDFTYKAFQFYFAKPVTHIQYLLGRTLSLIILVFSILFIPGLFIVLVLTGVSPEETRWESIGLLLPTFLFSLIAAVAVSVLAISISAISKSRALTMSAWLVAFVVPHVLALLVDNIMLVTSQADPPEGWPWLYLASIPGLLTVIREALLKINVEENVLQWWHATIVLSGMVAGGIAYALHRLRRAEVIT